MGRKARAGWGALVGLLGVGAALATTGVLQRRSSQTPTPAGQFFTSAIQAMDWRWHWDRLPLPLSLVSLIGIRTQMRQRNLYDTQAGNWPAIPSDDASNPQRLTVRTADGTYNDLTIPAMGSASTRFGRNVPLDRTWPDPEPAILTPNPRTVSRELLTRDEFIPATTLNMLAAAWIQFMVRDWFSHGSNQKENPWQIPLANDDPWPQHPMTLLRTTPDPTRTPAESGLPPTFMNTETHWWDGSQIYGSSKLYQEKVRTGQDGKLILDPNGLIPLQNDVFVQAANVPGWWIGLALMQTLFTHEHNAICDRLRQAYPTWSDDELFERARLVNAALLAKIHTVEWTPAILGHPTLQIAMRANWWGLEMERLSRAFGRLSSSEVLSGIPGSETDHFGVPYSLTEEFVAVYRMHPLIPDTFAFRAARDDALIEERPFREVQGDHAQAVLERVPLGDMLYTFGTMHPGAITLHNYPRDLQNFQRQDGILQDLATTDILRIRERGVPRYTEFRRLVHERPVTTFEELSDNPVWCEELRRVYNNDIDKVDLMVGMYAEPRPQGFGFSDTAFRIFTLMASRRLNSDRFFTNDFTPGVYSPEGMAWIDDNDMSTVLLRHYPALRPALRGVKNAFAPWTRTGAS